MTDRLRHLWLTAAAILALASCTQDDMGEGGSPYDGDSPVVFSATGITPLGATRATVDDDPTWEGTELVMVEVGGVEKIYVVNPSADKKYATLEALSGVEPFKWSEVAGETVRAKTFNGVQPDQSKPEKYRMSDIIAAEATGLTKDNNTLEFKHQVARLVITVSNGAIESDEVELVVGSQTIKPYCDKENSRYLALVNHTLGASVSVKIKHGGKDYIYTHTTNADLKGGESYTVNVTIFNPMHITDEATLKAWAEAVKDDPTVSAIVDNDFSMTAPADGASNWEPVSTFKGIFEGNGHTITGIVVNDNEAEYVGFICDNYGTVKNLTLKDAKITGKVDVGAVAGWNSGTIENCHVTGNSVIITGKGDVGAVAGINYGTILACHVAKECAVKGTSSYPFVGGIVGTLYYKGQVKGCYALCKLTGNYYIGGICGDLYDGSSVTACYSKCTYRSGSYIGGIVGEDNNGATYTACYWRGDTNCEKGVGSEATDPEGVNQITDWGGVGSVALQNARTAMNNKLEGYEFVTGDFSTSDDEPLVLVKKQ